MEALTFEEKGLVSSFIGKTGQIGYTKQNVLNETARVQLTLTNGKDVIKALLSPTLSRMFRSKQIGLGQIPTLNLSLSSNGVYNIHREQSEIIWVDAKDLKVRELVKVEVSQDDLIAL
jgi:hypothetical protein